MDLCVCTTVVSLKVLREVFPGTAFWLIIRNIAESLYVISVDASGFATFLLSITRCISVSVPMYQIRGFYVAISGAIFISFTVIREVAFWVILTTNKDSYRTTVHASFIFGGIGLMVASIALINLISVRNIMRNSDITEESREAGVQATVTVTILSGFFCLLNTFYIVSSVLHFYFDAKLSLVALKFGIFYSIPLNSALNPLIYFLRKKDMRRHLIDMFKIPWKNHEPSPRQEMTPMEACAAE
jgi:hypothetical protein